MFVSTATAAYQPEPHLASIHQFHSRERIIRYRNNRTVLRMQGMGRCSHYSSILPQADLLYMAVRILTEYRNEIGDGLNIPPLPDTIELQKNLTTGRWFVVAELPAGCSIANWKQAIRASHVTMDLAQVAGLEVVRETGGVVLELDAAAGPAFQEANIDIIMHACRTNHYGIDGNASWMFRRSADGRPCSGGTFLVPVARQHEYSYAC